MSDFSFDPSGAGAPSAFRKLVSGRIKQSNERDQRSERATRASEPRIFNEVQPAAGGSNSEEAARIAPLRTALTNISKSSASLEQIAVTSAEVAGSNADAAKVSVRDVEAAVNLANELSKRIVKDEQLAVDAQVNKLSVKNLELL